ncbi:hypothetical protein JF50_07645 [Pseudoalteromonas luteoviolacea]|uniref:Uncharacterized protein n=1 Tax=Pseudoalteromonas luteoviolacea TaxID=43657 RepID=A0A0C1QCD6_9GAMM|nr:hypothetical protein JF50_14515 [Pseudoalteromonas luteoviolacea]KID57112.1 hypothetical protein JF50_07645 [Pseudoalteromonas luteoviolacea]
MFFMFEYSPIIIGFSSVLLQFYILSSFRRLSPKLATKLYGGVAFSSKWEHQKKATNFLYNPKIWRFVKQTNIKCALYLNFTLTLTFLFLIFVGI